MNWKLTLYTLFVANLFWWFGYIKGKRAGKELVPPSNSKEPKYEVLQEGGGTSRYEVLAEPPLTPVEPCGKCQQSPICIDGYFYCETCDSCMMLESQWNARNKRIKVGRPTIKGPRK